MIIRATCSVFVRLLTLGSSQTISTRAKKRIVKATQDPRSVSRLNRSQFGGFRRTIEYELQIFFAMRRVLLNCRPIYDKNGVQKEATLSFLTETNRPSESLYSSKHVVTASINFLGLFPVLHMGSIRKVCLFP